MCYPTYLLHILVDMNLSRLKSFGAKKEIEKCDSMVSQFLMAKGS